MGHAKAVRIPSFAWPRSGYGMGGRSKTGLGLYMRLIRPGSRTSSCMRGGGRARNSKGQGKGGAADGKGGAKGGAKGAGGQQAPTPRYRAGLQDPAVRSAVGVLAIVAALVCMFFGLSSSV